MSGGDGLLFLDPALSVAADKGASTARVTAIVGLIQLLLPSWRPDLREDHA
ncbi:MAG TPA: hypothetical protein VL308_22000 [Gemmatimonadaceae bacterium]|nr:hypothetical protein [Gemmatimonadaceae bacterium]